MTPQEKAQELLSDRRFTLEDVRKLVNSVTEFMSHHEPEEFDGWFERKLQSLSQQSWKVELEMEDVFHKNEETHITDFGTQNLAVKSNYSTHYKQPKLKEGKIKILKLYYGK
jgi:cephalosporin-C deacetylase-like acetyl esterase